MNKPFYIRIHLFFNVLFKVLPFDRRGIKGIGVLFYGSYGALWQTCKIETYSKMILSIS